jgi:hypothetical protein
MRAGSPRFFELSFLTLITIPGTMALEQMKKMDEGNNQKGSRCHRPKYSKMLFLSLLHFVWCGYIKAKMSIATQCVPLRIMHWRLPSPHQADQHSPAAPVGGHIQILASFNIRPFLWTILYLPWKWMHTQTASPHISEQTAHTLHRNAGYKRCPSFCDMSVHSVCPEIQEDLVHVLV